MPSLSTSAKHGLIRQAGFCCVLHAIGIVPHNPGNRTTLAGSSIQQQTHIIAEEVGGDDVELRVRIKVGDRDRSWTGMSR